MDKCCGCGMVVRSPAEYHPYAACLIFNACSDGDAVRAILSAVRADAFEEAARIVDAAVDGTLRSATAQAIRAAAAMDKGGDR